MYCSHVTARSGGGSNEVLLTIYLEQMLWSMYNINMNQVCKPLRSGRRPGHAHRLWSKTPSSLCSFEDHRVSSVLGVFATRAPAHWCCTARIRTDQQPFPKEDVITTIRAFIKFNLFKSCSHRLVRTKYPTRLSSNKIYAFRRHLRCKNISRH